MIKSVLGVLIVLLEFNGLVYAIRCQICNNQECLTHQGYKSEECASGARFCYKLLNKDTKTVYRAGCGYSDCSRIQSKPRSECEACDIDNCNGLSKWHENQDGVDDLNPLIRGRNQQQKSLKNGALGRSFCAILVFLIYRVF